MTTTPFSDPQGRHPGDTVTAKGIGTEWRILAIREDPHTPGAVQYRAQRTDAVTLAEWIDSDRFETP